MNSRSLENLKIEAIKSIYQTFTTQAVDHTANRPWEVLIISQMCRLQYIHKADYDIQKHSVKSHVFCLMPYGIKECRRQVTLSKAGKDNLYSKQNQTE